ncbi:MAG: GMC family oxidoreductase [Deltaproteobacteria bacterium]|nr:GMC family oxidoreductase [Deltaproteobacteria bacterium]
MGEIRPGDDVVGIERVDCDVVVIGSGAGGATAAYELSHAGLQVIVLEAGPHVRSQDFTQRELDTVRRVYVDRGAQGPADGSLAILQGSCIGGSTIVNGEVCFRTPEPVLNEWARSHGVRGLGADELKPAFEDVERMIHVTVNDGRYLDSGLLASRGMKKLGIEPKPIARNVKDCRGCNYCFFGCAYGCKQSTDQSYVPAAMADGAKVICDARVERIELDRGRATGVTARTRHGTLEVRARAVVVSCGAIQTPLLLLDCGIGGSEVGKNLSVHPVVGPSGWFDPGEQPDDVSSLIGTYTDVFVGEGYLLEAYSGTPTFVAPFVPGFGREHKELVRDLRQSAGVAAVVRDTGGFGRVRRGRRGEKVIEYAIDAETRDKVRKSLRRVAEILFAAGARKVSMPFTVPLVLSSPDDLAKIDRQGYGPADIGFVSYHPQGTARLGAVTDSDGRVRDTRNVYVMDASLFPTPVGVNPQVSIMGVTTVLARRLAAQLR